MENLTYGVPLSVYPDSASWPNLPLSTTLFIFWLLLFSFVVYLSSCAQFGMVNGPYGQCETNIFPRQENLLHHRYFPEQAHSQLPVQVSKFVPEGPQSGVPYGPAPNICETNRRYSFLPPEVF